MNIFILCTGRSGSTTFIKACKHIENYTCGHETRSRLFGLDKFKYPQNHIEADNRLSWFLGSLEKYYGETPVYVHLIRNKEETVRSFNKRWSSEVSIIKAFSNGILMMPVEKLNEQEKIQICELYYDTINHNIVQFLSDKPKVMTIHLENIKEEFIEFWKLIDAKGELSSALEELSENHNKS